MTATPETDATGPGEHGQYGVRGDPDLDAYTLEASFVDSDPLTGRSWDERSGTDDYYYYYLRARQTDGGMAWAGPIWATGDGS